MGSAMIHAHDIIINFHGVGQPARSLEQGEAPFWINETFFLNILDLIAERYPRTHVTFDDGNVSDITLGLPALQERGMIARFFVLAGRLGQSGSLSAEDIAALDSAGMAIGVHGWDHVDWRRLDDTGRAREHIEARQLIARQCQQAVDEAAVPFGCYNARVLRALRNAGYRAIFTSDGGAAGPGPTFARTSIRQDTTLETVENILRNNDNALRKLRRRAAMLRKRLV